MEPRRLTYLICRLNRFELTEEQEAISEGVYNEKLRWAKLGLIREKSIARGLVRKGLTRSRNKLNLGSS